MISDTQAGGSVASTEVLMNSMLGGLRWGLDRMLAVGYGVAYDYIFERFGPYQTLKSEVLDLVGASVPEGVSRRDVRVLDIACGPGNMTITLAEAGFSVVGVDPYGALVEVAREKRRARHLANLAFREGDLARGSAFASVTFDQVVNIHSLYLHPEPRRLLREACRVLKPGGTAIFVNRARRISHWSTLRTLQAGEGSRAALRSLLWVAPNSIFEALRRPTGEPHYWDEDAFGQALQEAGFTVLGLRRTFLEGSSLLALARRDTGE
ncbi:MAG: class I SAM-dependent methyltransferase [Candidatus Rokubacteria bacterium]|nr:class I SAM-dependent methyltransferase [Candidatus Rokubacteria bacterium]